MVSLITASMEAIDMDDIILTAKQYESIKEFFDKSDEISKNFTVSKEKANVVISFKTESIFDKIFDQILGKLSNEGFNTDKSVNYLGKTLEEVIDKFLESNS